MKDKISLFDLSDDVLSNHNIIKSVSDWLEKKYNEKFNVTGIGNRYGMDSFDNADVYCCPADDKNCQFLVKVNVNSEGLNFNDDYLKRKMLSELEKYIRIKTNSKGTKSNAKIVLIGEEKTKEVYDIKEYIKSNDNIIFLANVVTDGMISKEDLNDILEKLKSEYNNISISIYIYMMDTSCFEEYCDSIECLTTTTRAIIEKNKILKTIVIRIANDEIIYVK